ncbi:MAG: VOC family protein [Nocardioides sp.]
MSRSSILNVTFDCSDAESVARFWSAVTRWPLSKVDMPGNPFWSVSPDGGASPHLVFVEVTEPKHAKNRVHLDLLPHDAPQDQEVARIEALGARIVDDRRGATPVAGS